jgi:hypothetical protein
MARTRVAEAPDFPGKRGDAVGRMGSRPKLFPNPTHWLGVAVAGTETALVLREPSTKREIRLGFEQSSLTPVLIDRFSFDHPGCRRDSRAPTTTNTRHTAGSSLVLLAAQSRRRVRSDVGGLHSSPSATDTHDLRVRRASVLVHIEAFQLALFRDAKCAGRFEPVKHG